MSLTDEDRNWIAATIAAAVTDSETRLKAIVERFETSLLTEFHTLEPPQ